jgi:hypothetical protein
MEVMVEYRGKLRLVICGANFDGHTADELVHLIRDNLKRDVGIVVRVEGPVQSERGVTNLFRPDAFLTLPFSAAQLIATVDELVRDRASKQEVSRRLPDPEDGKTLPFGKDSR